MATRRMVGYQLQGILVWCCMLTVLGQNSMSEKLEQLCPDVSTHYFQDPSTQVFHSCALICRINNPTESPDDCNRKCPEVYRCLVEAKSPATPPPIAQSLEANAHPNQWQDDDDEASPTSGPSSHLLIITLLTTLLLVSCAALIIIVVVLLKARAKKRRRNSADHQLDNDQQKEPLVSQCLVSSLDGTKQTTHVEQEQRKLSHSQVPQTSNQLSTRETSDVTTPVDKPRSTMTSQRDKEESRDSTRHCKETV